MYGCASVCVSVHVFVNVFWQLHTHLNCPSENSVALYICMHLFLEQIQLSPSLHFLLGVRAFCTLLTFQACVQNPYKMPHRHTCGLFYSRLDLISEQVAAHDKPRLLVEQLGVGGAGDCRMKGKQAL